MTLLRTGKLEGIREAFADLVGQWISEGTERRVTMEAAKDERGLLAVKLTARGDTVSISWAIEDAKQADLLAEIEAAYRRRSEEPVADNECEEAVKPGDFAGVAVKQREPTNDEAGGASREEILRHLRRMRRFLQEERAEAGRLRGENEELRDENRRLRAKIKEWADSLDGALIEMKTAWTEMRSKR